MPVVEFHRSVKTNPWSNVMRLTVAPLTPVIPVDVLEVEVDDGFVPVRLVAARYPANPTTSRMTIAAMATSVRETALRWLRTIPFEGEHPI